MPPYTEALNEKCTCPQTLKVCVFIIKSMPYHVINTNVVASYNNNNNNNNNNNTLQCVSRAPRGSNIASAKTGH